MPAEEIIAADPAEAAVRMVRAAPTAALRRFVKGMAERGVLFEAPGGKDVLRSGRSGLKGFLTSSLLNCDTQTLTLMAQHLEEVTSPTTSSPATRSLIQTTLALAPNLTTATTLRQSTTKLSLPPVRSPSSSTLTIPTLVGL